jgi:hypothetical protein
MLPFANDCRDSCLILAHVGRTIDRDRARQVRAVQQSKHATATAERFLRDLIGYCMALI